MLDENDVNVLEKMFERHEQRFDQKIDVLQVEMRQGFEGVQQEFVKVRVEMAKGFEKVCDDIIDVIDQNIQPQITRLTARVTRLERRIA